MADFEIPFNRTMKFEGATLEDVQGDSGGLTFCGIARNENPNWSGWAIIDEYLKAPNTFRQARTLALADQNLWALMKQYFFQNYWNAHRLGQFTSQELATQVYDAAVNLGDIAIKGLQMVLGVVDDGIVGPMTIQAANSKDVVDQFIQWRKNEYQKIVVAKPQDAVDLDGWLSRCVRSDR